MTPTHQDQLQKARREIAERISNDNDMSKRILKNELHELSKWIDKFMLEVHEVEKPTTKTNNAL